MMMHRGNIDHANRSGLYLTVTGERVKCENPACNGHAVAYDNATGAWLCQNCIDALYDARWGFGS